MSEISGILTTCPIQVWIPVISALLGAVLVLIGVSVANRNQRLKQDVQIKRQEKREERDTRRDKVEELYELLMELYGVITRKHSMLTSAVQSRLSQECFLKLADPLDLIKDPVPRMQVLVNLYFSSTIDNFQQLSKQVTRFRRIEAQIHERYLAGDSPSEDFIKDLNDQYQLVVKKLLGFREDVVLNADGINRSETKTAD